MAGITYKDEVPINVIESNLARVTNLIERSCERVHRDPREINLVCVTKNHSSKTVDNAIRSGIRTFGENRYQELEEKIGDEYSSNNIEWHFVGQVQSNKLKRIAQNVSMIHSIDRMEHFEMLSLLDHRPELLLQLSGDGNPARGGIEIDKAHQFIKDIQQLGITIAGVMIVAPLDIDPQPFFSDTYDFARDYGFRVISMGMSGDFGVAIECGATHIRIGSTIFHSGTDKSKLIGA